MLEMEQSQLKSLLEAILLAAGKPMSEEQILNLFLEEEKPSLAVLRGALEALQADFENRGIELVHVSSGYRLQVKQEWAVWVSRLWDEKPPKYSRALLETLALIAYRQPITRGEIEDIRGVAVSTSIIKTLQEEREWIRVVGYKEVPGRPALFASTKTFLDYFGLKSLKDLPPLPEVMNLDEVTLDFHNSLQSQRSEETLEMSEMVEEAELEEEMEESEVDGLMEENEEMEEVDEMEDMEIDNQVEAVEIIEDTEEIDG